MSTRYSQKNKIKQDKIKYKKGNAFISRHTNFVCVGGVVCLLVMVFLFFVLFLLLSLECYQLHILMIADSQSNF